MLQNSSPAWWTLQRRPADDVLTYSSKHASVNDTYFHSYVFSILSNKKAPLTESTEMPAGTGIAACWKPKA